MTDERKQVLDTLTDDPKELVKRLKVLLKTDDNEMLREHILRLSKAWGLKPRLPRVA